MIDGRVQVDRALRRSMTDAHIARGAADPPKPIHVSRSSYAAFVSGNGRTRSGVQSQIRLDSSAVQRVPAAQGENAGMIQQLDSWTKAGHFKRSPAPSVTTLAG